MNYLQLDVPDYTGPAHTLALEAAPIITAASGIEPDEEGRLEGPVELYGTEKLIVQVVMGLVDFCFDQPEGDAELAAFLRRAASLLDDSQ